MTASERALRIAVCAPGSATDEELTLAGAIGRLLAERRCTLVCGGLGGAMAAACRGAKEAGGVTIGIIPGYDDPAENLQAGGVCGIDGVRILGEVGLV